jgi:hypothetical protein
MADSIIFTPGAGRNKKLNGRNNLTSSLRMKPVEGKIIIWAYVDRAGAELLDEQQISDI